MADLATLKEHARTLERQGETDKALAIYRHILGELESTPAALGELPLFVKVGDLLLKQGNTDAAIATYEQAADHYASQGAANAVIALGSKILRAAPDRVAVYLPPARRLLGEGHLEATRAVLLSYAQNAGLRDVVALLERAKGRPDDDLRDALEAVIAGRQRAPTPSAKPPPVKPAAPKRPTPTPPAATPPAFDILNTEPLGALGEVSQDVASDPEPGGPAPPADTEPLLIDHATPPPSVDPQSVERVKPEPVSDEPVEPDLPLTPPTPFDFAELAAEEPPLASPPVADSSPHAAVPPVPPVSSAPTAPPARSSSAGQVPRAPRASSDRLSKAASRRRVRIRWAPHRRVISSAVRKWAVVAALVIAAAAGLGIVGVFLFGSGEDPEIGAPPVAVDPAWARARARGVGTLSPAGDRAVLDSLAGALPSPDPSLQVPDDVSLSSDPRAAGAADVAGGTPAADSALAPPAYDGGSIVAVEGLPVARISEFSVAGRTGYRVVQLLQSGERLTLTLTPAGPTVVGLEEPRITTLAGDTLLGTVHFGGFVVSAQARIAPDVLDGLLRRLAARRGT